MEGFGGRGVCLGRVGIIGMFKMFVLLYGEVEELLCGIYGMQLVFEGMVFGGYIGCF